MPTVMTRYDCPGCGAHSWQNFDGKVVHCRECGAKLIPKQPQESAPACNPERDNAKAAAS